MAVLQEVHKRQYLMLEITQGEDFSLEFSIEFDGVMENLSESGYEGVVTTPETGEVARFFFTETEDPQWWAANLSNLDTENLSGVYKYEIRQYGQTQKVLLSGDLMINPSRF